MDATDAPPSDGGGLSTPDDDRWDALEAAGDPFAPTVDEAVERAAAGEPVAVVGAPFGGRGRVLERVADRLDARLESVTPGAGPPPLDGPTVVADAHHLYRRAVGGFDPLDTVLERVARTDGPLVTGWNQHAWSYLMHARDITESFEGVAVLTVGQETMGTLVRQWAPSVTFEAPPSEEHGLLQVERRRYSVPFVGAREVPVPVVDPDAFGHRDAETDPEAAVLRRLVDLSNGNPGVARALWADCVGGDEHATVDPTTLQTPVERTAAQARERDRARRERGTAGAGTPASADGAGPDRRTAFCCRLVLAGERLPREAVAEHVRDGDRLLARLERRGYVTTTDAAVALRPAAVPDAVALTDGRRIP
jgi:hypothetical protein